MTQLLGLSIFDPTLCRKELQIRKNVGLGSNMFSQTEFCKDDPKKHWQMHVSIHVTLDQTLFEYQYVSCLHAWSGMKGAFGSNSLQTHLGLCDVAVRLLCGTDRWDRRPRPLRPEVQLGDWSSSPICCRESGARDPSHSPRRHCPRQRRKRGPTALCTQ